MNKRIAPFLVPAIAVFFAACGDYALKANADPGTVSPGGSGRLVIKIEARGKYHMEPEGIVMILFEPPDYVTLDKKELRTEDRGDDGTFSTKFTVAKDAPKGAANIKTNVTFQLCTETQCILKEDERIISVKIE